MQRFYVPGVAGMQQFLLPETESHHALRVLRHQVGDTLQVTDGEGRLMHCCITETGRQGCRVELLKEECAEPEKQTVHIAVAATKQTDRMEWMVEKLTEIGVSSIRFVLTERTERIRLNMDRMTKTAIAAMKQSQRLWLPLIMPPAAFHVLVNSADAGNKLIAVCPWQGADFHEKNRPSASSTPGSFMVLIGPEGDFTPAEIELAVNSGFKKVSLGSHILRTETAAIVALASLTSRLSFSN